MSGPKCRDRSCSSRCLERDHCRRYSRSGALSDIASRGASRAAGLRGPHDFHGGRWKLGDEDVIYEGDDYVESSSSESFDDSTEFEDTEIGENSESGEVEQEGGMSE